MRHLDDRAFFIFAFLAISSSLSLLAPAQSRVSATYSSHVMDDSIGASVARLGDVNGDGIADFIAGAPRATLTHLQAGRVLVISGFDGEVLMQVDGDMSGQRLGTTIAALGDVTGDGFPDFLAGTPVTNRGSTMASGHVRVFDGQTGALLYFIDGDMAGDQFGIAVAGIGDVTGDGLGDFVVGAPGNDAAGLNAGAATVYSGATGQPFALFQGFDSDDMLGAALSAAGDVDGDGTMDILVGAPQDEGNSGLSNSGSVRLHSGATGILLRTLFGSQANEYFGSSVAGPGDVDGDGTPDLAAGAPLYSLPGSTSPAGDLRVFSGATGAQLFHLSGQGSGRLAETIAAAGDHDGDGTPDLLAAETTQLGVILSFERSVHVISGASGTILESISSRLPVSQFNNFGRAIAPMGDLNGDGRDDLVIGDSGFPSTSFSNPFNAGIVRIHLADGPVLRRVNRNNVRSPINLSWQPDMNDPFAITGTMTCAEATPGGAGLLVASLDGADTSFYGYIPVLLNIDPFFVVAEAGFGFDGLGGASFANLSRQVPNLAGLHLHVQVFELSPVIQASNALVFEFSP